MSLDALNHGWRVPSVGGGMLVHDVLNAEWHTAIGLLVVDGRHVPGVVATMDDASATAVEVSIALLVAEDQRAAYEAHEREVAELTREPDEVPVPVRAAKYLEAMPASIQGSGGNGALFNAAQVLARGFDLSVADALPLLREYDLRSQPAWGEAELRRVLESARRRGRMERGAMLHAGGRAA